MDSYYNSAGSKIDFNTYEYSNTAYKVYGIDNIIEIIALGNDGKFYTIDIGKFNRRIANPNINEGNLSQTGRADQTADHFKVPFIKTQTLPIDHMSELSNSVTNNKAGAWLSNSSGDMSSVSTHADDRNSMDLCPGFDGAKKATQFFKLYNNVSAINDATLRGFRLFKQDDFNHSYNWMGYFQQWTSSYARYMLVMYMTKPRALLHHAFMDESSKSKSLISKLRNKDGYDASALATDLCNNENAITSTLGVGSHYQGTIIYSKNTKYHFIVQADGNCVTYDSEKKVIWNSGTWSKTYQRCRLIIDDKARFAIASTVDGSNVMISSKQVTGGGYLMLHNSGVLLLKSKVNNIILWASVPDNTLFTPPTSKENIFEWKSVYESSKQSKIFSPDLKFSLTFRDDGILVCNKVLDGSNVWSTTSSPSLEPSKMSIQEDGNVVIRNDKGVVLWHSSTYKTGKIIKTVLTVDNSGYVVIYQSPVDKNEWSIAWISKSVEKPYYVLGSGLLEKIKENKLMLFSDACITDSIMKDKDNSLLLKGRVDHCKSGENMFLDASCKIFFNQKDYTGDVDNAFKSEMDNYVKDELCTLDYDSRYIAGSKEQIALNKLCSCVMPIGDAKKLTDASHVPTYCFDKMCMSDGYRTIPMVNSEEANNGCPACMCIQSMDIKGYDSVSNVNQTCETGCTNLANSTSKTTSNTNTKITTSGGATVNGVDVPLNTTEENNTKQNATKDAATKDAADKKKELEEDENMIWGVSIYIWIVLLAIIMIIGGISIFAMIAFIASSSRGARRSGRRSESRDDRDGREY